MMQSAERRIDVSANNVSNISTPGYRGARVYSQILDQRGNLPAPVLAMATRRAPPMLRSTGNPTDLATDRGAVLLLRSGESFLQTRSVQLSRDDEGRLVDVQGRALQAAGGGDLVATAGALRILSDGALLVDGQPEGKVGLFLPSSDDGLSSSDAGSGATSIIPEAAEGGVVHQGMLVPSDVDLAAEMIELNRSSRMAETGAKIFQLYDELTSRAATLLGDTRK